MVPIIGKLALDFLRFDEIFAKSNVELLGCVNKGDEAAQRPVEFKDRMRRSVEFKSTLEGQRSLNQRAWSKA